MKKSLVLAMAMALGVTASAYAANPFSDVPAGHWAYDSIAKLTAAGVVDGYPDGSFKGQNLMTRYEMAQIVAKAMAKGANVDALAAEFADELDNLGVRVAALEKKVDNVKITGAIRYDYTHYMGDLKGSRSRLRSDLTLAGQVNEDWKYTAMWRYDITTNSDKDNAKDFLWQRAYLDGRLFGLKVRGGRAAWNDGSMANMNGSNVYDNRANILSLTYGKDLNFNVTMGNLTQDNATGNWYYDNGGTANAGRFWSGSVNAKFGATNARLAYMKFNDVNFDNAGWWDGVTLAQREDISMWAFGLKGKVGKALTLAGDYYKSNSEDQNRGWAVGVQYGQAKPAKVGSWDAFVKYMDMQANTVLNHGMLEGTGSSHYGIKGWNVGVDYTFAKNIMGKIMYASYKDTAADAGKDLQNRRTLWTSLHFTF